MIGFILGFITAVALICLVLYGAESLLNFFFGDKDKP